MRDIQQRHGLTYLFISHNLAVVRHVAGHVGVMVLGRIVELVKRPEMKPFGSERVACHAVEEARL